MHICAYLDLNFDSVKHYISRDKLELIELEPNLCSLWRSSIEAFQLWRWEHGFLYIYSDRFPHVARCDMPQGEFRDCHPKDKCQYTR